MNGYIHALLLIGVFGEPANNQKSPIAMTAPVITEPIEKSSKKIEMTSPVLTIDDKMSFILPKEFTTIDDVPKPTDNRVQIRQVPGQVVAISKFSGWYSPAKGLSHLKELYQLLVNNKVLDSDKSLEDVSWCVAQYHPPFTLPFLRRNEVWIHIDKAKITKVM